MRIEQIVGARIREAREAKGMTQEEFGAELAQYLGKPWPRQAVSIAEKGQRSFPAAELLACSMALGLNLADLFRPPFGTFELTFPSGITIGYDPSGQHDAESEFEGLRASLTSFVRAAEDNQRTTGEAVALARVFYDELGKLFAGIVTKDPKRSGDDPDYSMYTAS